MHFMQETCNEDWIQKQNSLKIITLNKFLKCLLESKISIPLIDHGLKFEEETNEMLHLEHGFVWC